MTTIDNKSANGNNSDDNDDHHHTIIKSFEVHNVMTIKHLISINLYPLKAVPKNSTLFTRFTIININQKKCKITHITALFHTNKVNIRTPLKTPMYIIKYTSLFEIPLRISLKKAINSYIQTNSQIDSITLRNCMLGLLLKIACKDI